MSLPRWRRALRLADAPVLHQQLGLVIGNIRSTDLGALVLVAMVRVALDGHADGMLLNLWCVLQGLVKLNLTLILRRFDRLGAAGALSERALHTLVLLLMANSAFGSTLWGGLIWCLPEQAPPEPVALILALLAIVLSGAVSTLGALLPLYLAFLLPSVALVAMRPTAPAIVEHAILGVTFVLFVLMLLDQARKAAQAAMSSIRLSRENAGLLADLRRESAALQEARQAAEAASAAKSKVLAAASHDLRQPVHAQGLFLSLLEGTELTPRQRTLLTHARDTVDASAKMLGTLFDFSRIEAGVIRPQRQAFAVQPLLNRIEREFAPQADARGLVYRSRESPLVVWSDPGLVELILRNLVSNAIRYTHRTGLLVVCRPRAGQAVLEVWDTGVGIPASQQHEVFREFHQLDNPERDRRKGFGLGLAIVDGLARTLGHELALASRPGRGSVFRLTLPRAAGPAAAGPAVEAAPPALHGRRILVVDDDESVLTGMRQLLQSWGCRCDVASTVDDALGLAGAHRPDLVICDFRLRGRASGVDLVAQLRALHGPALAALLVTGDTSPERLREAAAHGIELLQKPALPDPLRRAVVDALAAAQPAPA